MIRVASRSGVLIDNNLRKDSIVGMYMERTASREMSPSYAGHRCDNTQKTNEAMPGLWAINIDSRPELSASPAQHT